MKLEIGKRYRNGRGQIEEVAGRVKEFSEWIWTIQGNWYRQSDGRWITSTPVYNKGILVDILHSPWTEPTGLDLIEEVK